MNNIVITIDGPSGSGKGTTARGISKLLSIPHIDSGSIYRTLAYYLRMQDIAPTADQEIADALCDFEMSYDEQGRVVVDGDVIEDEIRSRINSKHAFLYSRNPIIRSFSNQTQRALLYEGGVLDGRDAGSVVAPHADLKIYLDCDVDERTRRRALQHNITDEQELAELKQEILDRDAADMNKGSASLHILPDSIVVDTSGMTVEEQIDAVYQLALTKIDK